MDNNVVWVNIAKWLKPVGSTFTVECEINNTSIIPKIDPSSLFSGNWIVYQYQQITQGVTEYTGYYIHFTRNTENNSIIASKVAKEEPSETPEWIAQNTDISETEWEYPVYRKEKKKLFITYIRIA